MSVQPLPETGSSTRHIVAAEVRAEMARQRRTGAEIARVLHISAAAMSRRTTGELAFDVDELASVAAFLRVPLTQLLGVRSGGHPEPIGGQTTGRKLHPLPRLSPTRTLPPGLIPLPRARALQVVPA